MNPAFGPLQVRELTSVFIAKSQEVREDITASTVIITPIRQLRDMWTDEIAKAGTTEPARIDALSWLGRTTLDIIGLAGACNYR